MADMPSSAHESVRTMLEKIESDGMTNVFQRFAAQGPRCTFCEQGLRCSLCSNGPCRIKKGAERGVCGIEGNAMAMRDMLMRNVLGTSTYTYHAQEVADTLRATAEGKTPFAISDESKLRMMADRLHLAGATDAKSLAIAVADAMTDEINTHRHTPSRMVEAFAPEKRKQVWRDLGIFPGGPLNEMMRCTSSCLTNVDADYKSLALKALRLGIACIYGAQVPLEMGQDALFGTAQPHDMEVDLGVLDPAYVNIVPSGHEPFVGAALIKAAHGAEVQAKARAAGAKGLRVIGSIETGQELIQRFPQDEVFAGFTGNWIMEEAVLATGAVDVFASDMNCTVPTLGAYGRRYNATVVPVSELVRIEDIDHTLDYRPDKAAAIADQLIDLAVENFKRRKGQEAFVPPQRRKAMVGFSAESILGALGGSLDPLLDVIKDGKIKGVVALVSCTTLKNGDHDAMTLEVARQLIARDILVLGMGCGVAALQVGGLAGLEAQSLAGSGLRAVCESLGVPPVLSFGTCTDTGRCALLVTAIADALGVDTPQLPVAVTAPEYMEQKATIDAVFAIAFGLYTHVSPIPPVTGAEGVVQLLTQDVEGLLGGKLAVADEPGQAVDGIEQHILSKRKALGI
ncbi:MAG: anaerobic carbon-monoxide dehydrogenase catalytic subunit [Armatimonadota bacterium]|nr:MAG: anaerobic carbon-monoxide dehydrogenase catalytic subunit [Armatimonadota bacterium]